MNNVFSEYMYFSAEAADMEKLPFDVVCSVCSVCSAGSLSYGDNEVVMNEIYRALKQKKKGGGCSRFT